MKKRSARIKTIWIIGFYLFISGTTLLYANEDKITQSGINKNQPISAGDYIYKFNCKSHPSGNTLYKINRNIDAYEYTYLYEGIEKNTIIIKTKTCPTLSYYHRNTFSKNKELFKEVINECLPGVHPIVLDVDPSTMEAVLLASDGTRLLIRVVGANRIVVNEMVVKSDPDIKYDKKYQEEVREIQKLPVIMYKPVIYLYPQQEQKVSVKLNYKGKIIFSYPKYDEAMKGWGVVAYPGGRIINVWDGKEYSYLFWEGLPATPVKYDFSKGFVVKGEDTANFLQNTLAAVGLAPGEYNEFIVYWLPRMQNNKYNLIHFATNEYEEVAKLDITPKPDTILRVFMVFKSLNDKVNIEAQEIKPLKREGFTVVEWGGTELK